MCVMTLTATAVFEETAPGRLGSMRVSIRRRILSGLLGRMVLCLKGTSRPGEPVAAELARREIEKKF